MAVVAKSRVVVVDEACRLVAASRGNKASIGAVSKALEGLTTQELLVVSAVARMPLATLEAIQGMAQLVT